ncbi:MAG: HEAT repeat domain-containing protein [bacterium]
MARAVLAMLDDPDEGVKARAAFVIGTLGIEAGADPLARLAVQNEALTFAALIALGQIRQEGARKAIISSTSPPSCGSRGHRPWRLPTGRGDRAPPGHLSPGREDPQTRAAAIWALAASSPACSIFVAPALRGPSQAAARRPRRWS